MNTQIYTKGHFMEMDSMHDYTATQISIKDNTLIVVYGELDKEGIGEDGLPYYEYKKLTIEYEIQSYCDAKVFKKNNYKFIDLLREKNQFDKLTKSGRFKSYKYSVDSFGELTLHFDIRFKNKGRSCEIELDAEKITYHWE
jgi:hypothetical protein